MLSAGTARGGSYPTTAAHIGGWLARTEAASAAGSLGAGDVGTVPASMLPGPVAGAFVPAVRALVMLGATGATAAAAVGPSSSLEPAAGREAAASVAASMDAALSGEWSAARLRLASAECVCHGSFDALAVLAAPPGSRKTDFLTEIPAHGSADGSAAAAATEEAGLEAVLGSVASTGGLVLAPDGPAPSAPQAASEVAATVERAGRRAVTSAGGATRGDDGSSNSVSSAPAAFAGPRGYDVGTMLGGLVVSAAAAAVSAHLAAGGAAAASGYGRHVAAERAASAARRAAEAAAGCGALVTSYAGASLRLLGRETAAASLATACAQAAREVRRVVVLPLPSAGLSPRQHCPLELSTLPDAPARAAALVLAAAAARALATSTSAAASAAVADGSAPDHTAAAVRAGRAVAAAVAHALACAPRVLQASPAPAAAASASAGGAAAALPGRDATPSGSAATGWLSAHSRPWSLVMIAKEPAPGHVKTRLAAELAEAGVGASAEAAAAVSSALLRDSAAALAGARGCAELTVYTVPAEAGGAPGVRAAVASTSWRVVEHGKAGRQPLSEVLSAALQAAQARCAGPVVFVGCDAPTLRAEDVERAAGAAWGGAAALLAAADGGYVALAVPHGAGAAVFDGVSWSAPCTLASQAAAAAADPCCGGVAMLPGAWEDVDTLDALRSASSALGEASATAASLAACGV